MGHSASVDIPNVGRVATPLWEQVTASHPAGLLMVSDVPGRAVFLETALADGGPRLTCLPADQILHEGGEALGAPFDLAVLDLAWLAVERREALAVIARLRDVLARRLLVGLGRQTGSEVIGVEDLRALGLTQQSISDWGQVFLFDLYDYKRTPDWLNAKYWANPELFDKYRW